jgi:hypothetical protein
MIVRYVNNSQEIEELKVLIPGKYNNSQELLLDKEQTYNVYGMTLDSDCIWYYLDTEIIPFPQCYPSVLFNLVNQNISEYWIYNFQLNFSEGYLFHFWSFPEWANKPNEFYNSLCNESSKSKEIYQNYKLLMDLEFPNPEIDLKAEKLEDSWLMCPICIDAWQTDSKAGMVICPKCKNIMHNPNYSD